MIFVNSYEFDIMNNPQKYIKSMIYMCLQIEELGTKSFQFFPLRTDTTVKYIPIDTKSIIEIFVKENNETLTYACSSLHGRFSFHFTGEKSTETALFKLSIQIFQPPVFNFKYTVLVHPNNLLG